MTSNSIPTTSGIYRITCSANGNFYIGSAINLYKRRYEHFRTLRLNTHVNLKLQHTWNKYGEQTFTFEIIELVLPPFLLEREQYWLDSLKPSFNIAMFTQAAHTGRKHTPEALAKISANRRGKAPHNLGKKHTPEAREKNKQAHLGKKLSPETRQKMSLSRMGNKINLGRKLTLEHRMKIGQAQLGRKASLETIQKRRELKHTPEARAKMSKAMQGNTNGKGKIASPEKREKIRQANLGRKMSNEAIEKHRQAMIGHTYDPEVYHGRMKTLIVTAPDGTEHTVHGIRQFCRDHGLNNSHLIQVAKGKCAHHKGWRARYA